MTKKRREKRRDSETWKRFLNEILSRFPDLIKKYPRDSQIHLNEFLTILKGYNVDTRTNRTALSKQFEEFVNKHQNSQEYLQLPFLWFARRYFADANLILSVEGFYAHKFYEYLVQHLRGNSLTTGVFQLIRTNTPLTDLAWEQLQYASMKLQVPLTGDQLQVLETVYSTFSDIRIQALNPRRVRRTIADQVRSPRLSRELSRFFKLVEARWFLQFYPPAFGLTRLYFHFQLKESTSLTEIIDFQNIKNSVLCYSDVYSIRGFPNAFIGTLVIPTHEVDKIKAYLSHCERQGHLILHTISQVNEIHWSTSLGLYRAERGWGQLNQTQMRLLTQQLKTRRPRERQVNLLPFFITPAFNPHWNFKQHHLSSQIIALYCTIPREFSYDELPIGSSKRDIPFKISKLEIDLLKDLVRNQVIATGLFIYRLWYEFSLNAYWIKLPRLPLQQIKRLLQWLPLSELIITDKNAHIRTRLSPELVEWIKNDLEWVIMPIIRNHYPLNLRYEWYKPEQLKWKTPIILQT